MSKENPQDELDTILLNFAKRDVAMTVEERIAELKGDSHE